MNQGCISPTAYDEAEKWANGIVSHHEILFNPKRFQEATKESARDIHIPEVALRSLVRNASLNQIKKTAPGVKRRLPSVLKQYKNGVSIVSLARELNFSPFLLARYAVEEMCTFKGKRLSDAMRDPEGMLNGLDVFKDEYRTSETEASGATKDNERPPLSRLAMEVREATETDPLYGPMHDRERHIVGVEYEVVLEQELHALGIPFKTEADLRDRGTSRTPDILLICPMGVLVQSEDGSHSEWKMISWIDSKAMFGDVATHQTSVLPQAEAYIHRYGPGMVLYWFGHAPLERLGNSQGDIVISAWDLPEKFMWPTGEILTVDNKFAMDLR